MPAGSLEHGKLYISCRYRAVHHLCACGCGARIHTPLHPTGWRLLYDGRAVSLIPSVGNWSEKCQSHYVIRDNKVLWGGRLPRRTIEQIRTRRHLELEEYYAEDSAEETGGSSIVAKEGWWAKTWNFICGR